jgi:hypothetical protein
MHPSPNRKIESWTGQSKIVVCEISATGPWGELADGGSCRRGSRRLS